MGREMGRARHEFKKANMTVVVDAQVFLRIAKHAKQNFPASASGSLLGLDGVRAQEDSNRPQESGLRVTNCFAFRAKKDEDVQKAVEEDFTEYQYDVLRTLGEVRVDANAVGWYESTHHGNFLNEGFIESQYTFQKHVASAVVLVYDPFQQKIGKCGFQAYRLTEKAMRQKEKEQASEDSGFDGFPSDQLLEQVPITVYCSPLIETYLLQTQTLSFESLDMNQMAPALERNVQLLLESLDEFSLQQREMQMYERQTRAQKDKMKNQRTPKYVDTLNLSKQIQHHCKTIDDYSADSLSKLFMVSPNSEVGEVMKQLLMKN